MNRDSWGKIECGRWEMGRAVESNEEKMGTTIIEQQFKKLKIIYGRILGILCS